MQTITQTDDVVRQKTLELCQAIVQQPQFQSIRQRVDSFMANPAARQLYQNVSQMGHSLHDQQHQGIPLNDRDIAAFESGRDALMRDPVAKGFIDAQEEMHQLQEGVLQFVHKTFELGRVPSADDLQEDGSCGESCGCHH